MNSLQIKGFTTQFNGIAKRLVTNLVIGESEPYQTQTLFFCDKFKALWDTGATRSAIKSCIAKKYSLDPLGPIVSYSVSQKYISNLYLISLKLPNNTVINELEVGEIDDCFMYDILIGMDIIGMGAFLVNTFQNITTFSFQIPAFDHISLPFIIYPFTNDN
jgi:hypothetical protein